MFGKKKEKDTDPSAIREAGEGGKEEVRITKIPDVFYGGVDPEIYHRPEAAQPDLAGAPKAAPKTEKPKRGAAPGKSIWENKKLLYIGGGAIFIIIVGLISWYYISQSVRQAQPALEEPRVEEPEPTPEPTPEPPPEADQPLAEEPVPTTTPALEDAFQLEFPRIIIVDGTDLDADSLTDIEEEFFNTDSGSWDSDGDGYYDGQEVVNLYSPKANAPAKLVDSGLIREYVNPTWQYRLYYPLGWEAAAVDTENAQVLFSSVTGDYVEIVAIEKELNKTFPDWFAENAKSQEFSDITSFTNRFQEDGFRRQDSLVAYFVKDKVVYVMIYHPGSTGFIPFRHMMIMMMQSFRPTDSLVDIPDQPVLPEEGVESAEPASLVPDEETVTATTTVTSTP